MFIFTIEVIPKADAQDSQDRGGAFVVCWINFPDEEGAEHLARFYLDSQGWLPLQTDRIRFVQREDVLDNPEQLQYFLEATDDGACFDFHNWRAGGEGDTT